jgi:hypothetical protein
MTGMRSETPQEGNTYIYIYIYIYNGGTERKKSVNCLNFVLKLEINKSKLTTVLQLYYL